MTVGRDLATLYRYNFASGLLKILQPWHEKHLRLKPQNPHHSGKTPQLNRHFPDIHCLNIGASAPDRSQAEPPVRDRRSRCCRLKSDTGADARIVQAMDVPENGGLTVGFCRSGADFAVEAEVFFVPGLQIFRSPEAKLYR